jgi:hypothetical protein
MRCVDPNEGAENSGHEHYNIRGVVQTLEIDANCEAEKQQSMLQHKGQRVNDYVEAPLPESHEPGMASLPSIDDTTRVPRRNPTITQGPLFRQHRKKGRQYCERQTSEEEELSIDNTEWGVRDRCQRVGSTKRGVLL